MAPIIGDNVAIYAGSVVAGPIIIGNKMVQGVNSTVTFDMKPHFMI